MSAHETELQSTSGHPVGLGVQRSLVVPEFFEDAEAMRGIFDQRFQRARSNDSGSFVWDYWHVPDQYTYLRTKGDRYFPEGVTADLMGRLRGWGLEVLGCGTVTPPWFSYYIDGCVQEIHADVPHGPWAYVFSLTRWEERGFTGGETLMLRPEALDFWRGFDPKQTLEAGDVFDVIPASFNQLTVFDARVPHGVRAIRGTQDPLDSRVVLHGWFKYPELTVSEALQSQKSRAALQLVLRHLGSRLQEIDSVTGLLTVRVEVDGDGGVREARPLSNTLVSTGGNPLATREVVEVVLETVRDRRLPTDGKEGWAVLPFRVPYAS
jgi:hypothetical protein